jgi:hypothetical protein
MNGKVIAGRIVGNIYEKFEYNDDCIFKKTSSLSINAKILEKVDAVKVHLIHLNKTVFATKKDIKSHKDVKTFHGETKYYYPVDKWKVI